MRKSIIAILVIGMASMAQATVINVVAIEADLPVTTPLVDLDIGTVVQLGLVLDIAPTDKMYGMNVSLTVTGPGTLSENNFHHTDGLIPAGLSRDTDLSDNKVENLTGLSSGGLTPAYLGFDEMIPPYSNPVGPFILRGYEVTVTGAGVIDVDLGPYVYMAGEVQKIGLTSTDVHRLETIEAYDVLGDLCMTGIPEPMTIALLGIGGLGLIYRRRRA